MTKSISLTKGKFALVDDEWFEKLNQYKWWFSSIGLFNTIDEAKTAYDEAAKKYFGDFANID